MLFEEDPEHPAGRIPTSGWGATRVPRHQGPLWSFGMLAGLSLALMLLTGVFLAMNYVVGVQPYETIQWIMRDVSYGWLIRFMHMAGTSIFFVIAFVNVGRSLYSGSYKRPGQRSWMLGLVTLILMMLTAYTGYLLPWGQMSYWSTLALAHTAAGFPFVGHNIVRWIMGGDGLSGATLTHFYTFHILFAFAIVAAVMAHMSARRADEPAGAPESESESEVETVTFHPFYTVRAAVAGLVFLMVGTVIVFFIPYTFEQSANLLPADPLVMPSNVTPQWYLLPFYAMTRCTESPLLSLGLVVAGWVALFALPWLDPSPVRSARHRPLFQPALFGFFIVVILLGWAGAQPATSGWVLLDRLFTLLYFLFFLVGVPLLGVVEAPGVSLRERMNLRALLQARRATAPRVGGPGASAPSAGSPSAGALPTATVPHGKEAR